MYRAYSNVETVEIWRKDLVDWTGIPPFTHTNLVPVLVSTPFHPTSEETKNGIEGTYILKSLPTAPLTVAPFEKGSRLSLEKAINYMTPRCVLSDKEKWDDIAKLAPQTDDSAEYLLQPNCE